MRFKRFLAIILSVVFMFSCFNMAFANESIQEETNFAEETVTDEALSESALYTEPDVSSSVSISKNIALADEESNVNNDIVLVLDVSGSMEGKRINTLKEAATKFSEAVINASSGNRIGIIAFGAKTSTEILEYEFTNDIETLKTNIENLYDYGGTPLDKGINYADNMFITSGNENVVKSMVIMSDGDPDSKSRAKAAYDSIADLYNVYSVYLGSSSSTKAFMESIQNSGFFNAEDVDDLIKNFADIVKKILKVYMTSHIDCKVGDKLEGDLFGLWADITPVVEDKSVIVWESSNTEVVEITGYHFNEGTSSDILSLVLDLDCKAVGESIITVTTPDGTSAKCLVTVSENSDPIPSEYGNKKVSFEFRMEEGDSGRNKPFDTYKLYDYRTGQEVEKELYYNDNYFSESSYVFNNNLLRVSMCLALSAFDKYNDYAEGPNNAIDFLSSLDFTNITSNPYYTEDTKYNSESNNNIDTIGVVAGQKQLSFNNEDYTLIALGIRGGGYGKEWGGNFRVDTNEEHKGFELARTEVCRFLNEYIKNNNITGNVKIWITGYSRAAATTNMTAALLDSGNGIDGDCKITLKPENIYAFCFETPAGTRTTDKNISLYDNIISIVNPIDFVPKVAFSKWDFGRYGRTFYTSRPSTDYNYKDMLNGINVTYKSITDKELVEPMVKWGNIINGSVTQDIFLDNYLSVIATEGLLNQNNYVDKYQNIVMPLMASILGGGGLNINIDEKYLKTNTINNAINKILYGESFIDYIAEELAIIVNSMGYGSDLNKQQIKELLGAIGNDHLTDLWALITNTDAIFSGHYPELCLSWVLNIDAYYHYNDGSALDFTTRRLTVNCPVDISVYDSNNILVAQIIDDDVTDIADVYISCYIDEAGQKIVYLPNNEEFSIKINATEDGSMTYSVSEYNVETLETETIVNYYDVPITKGETLSGTIENLSNELGKYSLTDGKGQKVPASEKLTGKEISDLNVSVFAEEGGVALGNKTCIKGEYAEVLAEAYEGYKFSGWYSNNALLSKDSDYRFCVLDNTDLVAKFEKTENAYTETTTKRSSGGSGGRSYYAQSGKVVTTESETEETTESETAESLIADEVRVTIGKKAVTVGGKEYETDGAAYIQAQSNSTMVPLRFVALAILGADVDKADESGIVSWDAATKTAVIKVGGKTVEFTAGSGEMVIDGVAQVMENGVKAEIVNGRMYIPFRALGKALGVSVDWEADTKTAVYKAKLTS